MTFTLKKDQNTLENIVKLKEIIEVLMFFHADLTYFTATDKQTYFNIKIFII